MVAFQLSEVMKVGLDLPIPLLVPSPQEQQELQHHITSFSLVFLDTCKNCQPLRAPSSQEETGKNLGNTFSTSEKLKESLTETA